MSWNSIHGHAANLDQLKVAFQRGRLAHAYLFVGPSGTGKKKFAFELAKALLCERPMGVLNACGTCPACKQFEVGSHPDFFYARKPDDKSELNIETVRTFAENLGTKAARGGRKIGILDDADSINDTSANFLLKTLEEPPAGTLLILIATTEESQLPTILSRCQKVRFQPLAPPDLLKVLEELELGPAEHLAKLASLGGGTVEQAMALDSEGVLAFREAMVKGLADARPDTVGLAGRWIAFVAEAGKEAKARRPRALAVIRLLMDFLRSAMAASLGETVAEPNAERLKAHADADTIAEMLEHCDEAYGNIEAYVQVELVIEQLMDRLTVRPAKIR